MAWQDVEEQREQIAVVGNRYLQGFAWRKTISWNYSGSHLGVQGKDATEVESGNTTLNSKLLLEQIRE